MFNISVHKDIYFFCSKEWRLYAHFKSLMFLLVFQIRQFWASKNTLIRMINLSERYKIQLFFWLKTIGREHYKRVLTAWALYLSIDGIQLRYGLHNSSLNWSKGGHCLHFQYYLCQTSFKWHHTRNWKEEFFWDFT